MYRTLIIGILFIIAEGSFVNTVSAQFMETKLTASDGEAGELFGRAVSLSGDYALVGAEGDDDNGYSAGSAYIFRREGTLWIEEAKLTASDGAPSDGFGGSVSLSGDYALIGAGGDDGYTGSAYIFHREGTLWIEEAKLTASDPGGGYYFGYSVSLSGDYALVGTINDVAGAAYIFRREGTLWIEEAKLTASDHTYGDGFGYSVSLSGDNALIGAPWNDLYVRQLGAAYIFRREGTLWIGEARFTASDGGIDDFFGSFVSLSGDYALVGDYGHEPYDIGAAYIFHRVGSAWIEEAKLTASDGQILDSFGFSVSLSGDYALVGANGDDNNGTSSGSAYIFRRVGTLWIEEAKLTASGGAAYDYFGYSVSLSGDYALVGAYGVDGYTGSAYVYSGVIADSVVAVAVTVRPSSGNGAFEYKADLTNTSDSTLVVDVWTEMSDPRGNSKTDIVAFDRILESGIVHSMSKTANLGEGAPLGDYHLTVYVGDYPGNALSSASASYTRTAFGKGEVPGSETPAKMELFQNTPNPFNPSTTVLYALSQDSHVRLAIYNMLGQVVATLVDEPQTTGYKSVAWNGKNDAGASVSSGIYIYRMAAGTFTATKRMLFLK